MERLGYPKSIDGNHAFIKACDEDLRKMIDQNHGLIKAHDEEMERIKQMADDMFTMEQESMGHCFPHKRRKIEKLLLMSEIINLRHNKMMNEMALLEADERMSILAQEHQVYFQSDKFYQLCILPFFTYYVRQKRMNLRDELRSLKGRLMINE
ncbi:uncharacterized protein LOC105778480 [Gossypium raimondii]|uniref:uncharacterized protein LOC105778480 n=1 Tax=Gossypium raimondii TaxID=29730 RepID=UPI00227B2FE4|nr:uncharacterized protein LOC105778480 [Gossypium raimondii]